MTAVLETSDLVCKFGDFVATDRVNLSIKKGARHALIGPNGAGKTTLINLITGFLTPTSGTVTLMESDITGVSSAMRCRMGIVRTFQVNQLFPDMSVIEAVSMAVGERMGLGFNWWKNAHSRQYVAREAVEILDRLALMDCAEIITRKLPYGRQRLVEIALALALKPKVLLLDEPAAGVPTAESDIVFQALEKLPASVAILLIEHDMNLVFQFAEELTVLVNGGVLVQGPPDMIANDPRVKEVYLGHGGNAA